MTLIVKPSRKPDFWALVEGKEPKHKPVATPAPKKPKPQRAAKKKGKR